MGNHNHISSDIFKNDTDMEGEPKTTEEPKVVLGEDGQPLSKNQIKNLEKAKKKAAEKEAKAQLAAQKKAEKEAADNVPIREISSETDAYGELPLICSKTYNSKVFTEIGELSVDLEGQDVLVRSRLHNVRKTGPVLFMVLRKGFKNVQAVAFGSDTITKELVKYINKIPRESLIDVYGKVTKPDEEIKSCSQSQVEIQVTRVHVVSRSETVLPIQLEDCMRFCANQVEEEGDGESLTDAEKKDKMPTVPLQKRLDHRILDLRIPSNQAIFRLQAAVCQYYRETMMNQGFMEIHTPKLLGGSSEGGANVFSFKYFGRDGCLAQSPQLYKQMAIMSDFGRVFEIGPVFRAENSMTPRHLCEFVGLDFEMEIKESYLEVLDTIENTFSHIFTNLEERSKELLNVVCNQYPFEEFKMKTPVVRLTFQEGVDLLKEHGIEQDLHDDLDTVNEKTLGRLVREKYETDFYILHRYPVAARPFYTMLCPDDERFTCSYDVFMRGEEIISGAQRIHDVELLIQRAKAKGMDVATLKSYIDSFKYGACPHGGVGVGMERVVKYYLNLHNIKKASMFPRDPTRLEP